MSPHIILTLYRFLEIPLVHALLPLFVADLIHPIDHLTIKLFLNGDMGHGIGCRDVIPMLFTRWKPNRITGTNFIDRAILALCQTATSNHDQDLT